MCVHFAVKKPDFKHYLQNLTKMESYIYYNAIANSYEKLYREEQLQKALFIKRILDGYNIKIALDVGAGTGILEEVCSNTVFDIVEPSISMLRILKSKHLSNIRKIYDKKIEDIDVREKFDAVISLTVLQDVTDKKEFVNKLFSFSKERGLVIISYLDRSKINIKDYIDKIPIVSQSVANDKINVFLNV